MTINDFEYKDLITIVFILRNFFYFIFLNKLNNSINHIIKNLDFFLYVILPPCMNVTCLRIFSCIQM